MKVVTITNITAGRSHSALAGLYTSYLKEIKGREAMLILVRGEEENKTMTEADYKIISIGRNRVEKLLMKLVNSNIDVVVMDYTPDTEVESIKSILACSDILVLPFVNSNMDIVATKFLLDNLATEQTFSKIRLLPVKMAKKHTSIEKMIKKNFGSDIFGKDKILTYINDLEIDLYVNINPNLLVKTNYVFNKILD